MNTIARPEHAHVILGVEGRMMNAIADGNGLFVNQAWVTSCTKGTKKCVVKMRFDDNCKNGHQTFAITGTLYEYERGRWRDVAGGQIREDIARFFPELTPLMAWHLVSTDGPMHYVANTVYLAGDRDCWGLRKGEQRQIRNGRTGKLSWELVRVADSGADFPRYVDSDTLPGGGYRMEYRPWMQTGEGKDRQLGAARRAAVWPDATDDELTADVDALTAALEARLPALMARFRAAMTETCGFEWREVAP